MTNLIEDHQAKIDALEKRINDLVLETHERQQEIWTLEERLEKYESPDREAERREQKARRALDNARATAIRAIAKLVPQAVRQARAGKPALLRLILRATR